MNYRFYFISLDYLSSENTKSLLLHFWSLSLQQQFYFLWPILFLYLFKYMNILIPIFVIISYVLCCYYSNFEVSYSYFSFTTRFWEIGCGCIFYFINRSEIYSNNVHSFFSLLFILLFSFYYNSTIYSYPSYITLFPVIAKCLLLINKSFNNNFFLLNRLFLFSGTISYSFYIIHFPFIQILNNLNILIMIIICCASSLLVYEKIEKNYSQKPYSSVKVLMLWLFINGIIIFALVAILLYKKKYLKFIFDDKSGFTKFNIMQKTFLHYNLDGMSESFLHIHKFVLLGDCHIQQWIPILSKIAFQHGYIVFHIYYWSFYIEKGNYKEVFRILNSIGHIDGIFLSQFLGYKPYMRNYTQFVVNFKLYLNMLYNFNYTKDIYVIQNTGYNNYSVRLYIKNMNSKCYGYIGINFTRFLLPSIPFVKVIDMNRFICKNNVCPFIVDDYIVYTDRHHLNPYFVEYLYNKFNKIMNKKFVKQTKSVDLKRKNFYKTAMCCNNRWEKKNRRCMVKGD